MKVVVDKQSLQKAISTVIKATALRSAHQALEGILLEAKNNSLSLYATDNQIQISTVIDADVIREGKTLVLSKKFNDIIRNFDSYNVDIEVDDNNQITMSCSNSVFNIAGMDYRTFPNREVYNMNEFIKLDNELLKSMIRETIFACASMDSVSPILTGILVENKDEKLKFVAIDGFRMAIRNEELKEKFNNNIKCVVPQRTLNELGKILQTYDDEVFINISSTKFIVNIGKTQLVSNLLQGNFIDYNSIIPSRSNTKVKINRLELLSACERASIITDEGKNNLIRMDFSDGVLKLSSRSTIGKMEEEMEVLINGDDVSIAFNSRYFIDVLKNIKDDRVILEFNDHTSPCLINPIDNKNYLYLIMPVRLNENE